MKKLTSLKSSLLFSGTMIMSMVIQAQTLSQYLESSMAAVMTVSIIKEQDSRTIYGMSGVGKTKGQESEMAYEKHTNFPDAPLGSGFVIVKDGKKYIVTNVHVIQNADSEPGSIVGYSIARKKYNLKVVGGDSFYDLAVLSFIDTPGPEINSVRFRMTPAELGEPVFAIGNPMGDFPYSVTDGIISGKNRIFGGLTGKYGYLQTTAMIYGGNSGGPLVDLKGQVLGMITSYIPAAPQLNFALEGILAARLVNEIISWGQPRRAYLGLEISQRSEREYYYRSMDEPDLLNNDSIPVISGVIPNSSADASLSSFIGWNLVRVGKVDTKSLEEVLGEFEKIRPGSLITLELEKDLIRKTVQMTAGQLDEVSSMQIINFAFRKCTDYKIFQKADTVFITLPEQSIEDTDAYFPENEFYYDEDSTANDGDTEWPDDDRESRSPIVIREAGDYPVLSAGTYNSNLVPQLWNIRNLQDLAAVLRLCGQSGVIMIKYSGTASEFSYYYYSDEDIISINLSGREDIVKSIIWY